jgi:hypothetical protein
VEVEGDDLDDAPGVEVEGDDLDDAPVAGELRVPPCCRARLRDERAGVEVEGDDLDDAPVWKRLTPEHARRADAFFSRAPT